MDGGSPWGPLTSGYGETGARSFSTNCERVARVGYIMRDFRNLLAWGRALASLSMFDAHPNFCMSQQHVRRLCALCRPRCGDHQNGNFPRADAPPGVKKVNEHVPQQRHEPVKCHAGRGKRQNVARLSAAQQAPRAPLCIGSC
jgi:hypothetical protein